MIGAAAYTAEVENKLVSSSTVQNREWHENPDLDRPKQGDHSCIRVLGPSAHSESLPEEILHHCQTTRTHSLLRIVAVLQSREGCCIRSPRQHFVHQPSRATEWTTLPPETPSDNTSSEQQCARPGL